MPHPIQLIGWSEVVDRRGPAGPGRSAGGIAPTGNAERLALTVAHSMAGLVPSPGSFSRELALKRKKPTWLASALSLNPMGVEFRYRGSQSSDRDLNFKCGVMSCRGGVRAGPLKGG